MNLFRYFWTVKYLKRVQIFYQIYYRLRGKWRWLSRISTQMPAHRKPLDLHVTFKAFFQKSYLKGNSFLFLNQIKAFGSSVNWNYMGYGKLWNYNLLYFEYLNQPDIVRAEQLRLMHDFWKNFDRIQFGRDPYPISLRCINWIKFLINTGITDRTIEHAIYKQYYLLKDNIEYHLLGNHLLENGCSLLIGGIYFDDEQLYEKGNKIVMNQLNEQILSDGGHFERSPMYHQLMLYRLLDCYNMLAVYTKKESEFEQFLKNKIEKMLGWLNKITFNTGAIPRVNDTTSDIAPTTEQLNEYAGELGLQASDNPPNESGYRMIKNKHYEWLIDVGDIGPDYIPGHAHSDTFSFILNLHNKPIIVDTGISSYEECERRTVERSTASHNTVMVNEEEQTDVWKAFRVGRRAHVSKLEERPGYISVEHDGFKHMGFTHCRIFKWQTDRLLISDSVFGKRKKQCTAFIHFHPEVGIDKKDEKIFTDDIEIIFEGHNNIQINSYQYAMGFNQLKTALMLKINFRDTLDTYIIL